MDIYQSSSITHDNMAFSKHLNHQDVTSSSSSASYPQQEQEQQQTTSIYRHQRQEQRRQAIHHAIDEEQKMKRGLQAKKMMKNKKYNRKRSSTRQVERQQVEQVNNNDNPLCTTNDIINTTVNTCQMIDSTNFNEIENQASPSSIYPTTKRVLMYRSEESRKFVDDHGRLLDKFLSLQFQLTLWTDYYNVGITRGIWPVEVQEKCAAIYAETNAYVANIVNNYRIHIAQQVTQLENELCDHNTGRLQL